MVLFFVVSDAFWENPFPGKSTSIDRIICRDNLILNFDYCLKLKILLSHFYRHKADYSQRISDAEKCILKVIENYACGGGERISICGDRMPLAIKIETGKLSSIDENLLSTDDDT